MLPLLMNFPFAPSAVGRNGATESEPGVGGMPLPLLVVLPVTRLSWGIWGEAFTLELVVWALCRGTSRGGLRGGEPA